MYRTSAKMLILALTVLAMLTGARSYTAIAQFGRDKGAPLAIALLIVFQPDLNQTLVKATQRGLGTLVGAVTATAVIGAVNSGPAIVVIVLIATIGAVAFYSANYMIYAFFLTNAVLLYYWLALDHQDPAAGENAPVQGRPPVKAMRDRAAVHAQRAEKPGEHLGRLERQRLGAAKVDE